MEIEIEIEIGGGRREEGGGRRRRRRRRRRSRTGADRPECEGKAASGRWESGLASSQASR